MVKGRCACRANSVFCQALMWSRICSRKKLIWCCRCLSWRRASWSALARVSNCATCCSMTSNCLCAFTAGSKIAPGKASGRDVACYASTNGWQFSIYDSDAAPPAQLFNARNKTAVWTDIISVGLHHHHEVAGPLYVEQHLGLASSLMTDGVQRVHSGLRGRFQRHTDADGARQLGPGLFQRLHMADKDLGAGPFLYPDAGLHQHGDFLLQQGLQFLECIREYYTLDAAGHVFQGGLGVKIAFARLEHPHLGDDAGSVNQLVAAGSGGHRVDRLGSQGDDHRN